MTEKKPDPTSDETRTDPKKAAEARKDLEKDAQAGLKKAVDSTKG